VILLRKNKIMGDTIHINLSIKKRVIYSFLALVAIATIDYVFLKFWIIENLLRFDGLKIKEINQYNIDSVGAAIIGALLVGFTWGPIVSLFKQPKDNGTQLIGITIFTSLILSILATVIGSICSIGEFSIEKLISYSIFGAVVGSIAGTFGGVILGLIMEFKK